MKLGARTRSGLVLLFGVLAGVGFIALPGILTSSLHPNKTTTPRTSTNSTITPPPYTVGSSETVSPSNQTSTPRNGTDNMIFVGVLPRLFGLLIVPALAISLLTMVVASRRIRRPRVPEDQMWNGRS